MEMDPLLPEARMDFRPNLWKLFHSVGVVEVRSMFQVYLEVRVAEAVGHRVPPYPLVLEHTDKVMPVQPGQFRPHKPVVVLAQVHWDHSAAQEFRIPP